MTKEFWEYETDPIVQPKTPDVIVTRAWRTLDPCTFTGQLKVKVELSTTLPLDETTDTVPYDYATELGRIIIDAVNEYYKKQP